MQLITACDNILLQLSNAVEQIQSEDFTKPSTALSQASIGQHVRHTLEFFICLENGFEEGNVNYDKREHDILMESDKHLVLATISKVREFICCHTRDKKLLLHVGYERNNENFVTLETNYFRELTYNIEHAVHHMAIMKIGIREISPYVNIAHDFGVAVSTVRFKESSAIVAQ